MPADHLEALAKKFGAGPYASARTGVETEEKPGQFFVREDGNDFVLNIPSVGEVKLLSALAANGAEKTHSQWQEYSRTNPDKVVVPNSVVIYQILRGLYHLKDNPVHDKCVLALRKNLDRPRHTGTKVVYKTGLEAAVTHLQSDKSSRSIDLDIPEFTRFNNDWSYLVLADKQAEVQLGTVKTLPENATSVLEALLGDGYGEAGAVFQYVSSRKNNNLREVRLWTPTKNNRKTERAVVLGVYDGGGWFGIGASVVIDGSWPALGVVYTGAKNFPQEMKVT
ncbi:MAG: hypothetical protein HY363_05150 [Candidatus Aenigmarchaeota archaeon]|nr:hypothetical protein [Candidatus Aenigmarchaeota archaeon]